MSLSPGRLVIGRSQEAELRVPSPAVSRQHCEIEVGPSGLVIRDLGSRNGTFVNCQRTPEQPLKAGDLIAVGPAVLVVRIDGEPAEIDALDAYEDGMPSLATPGAVNNATPEPQPVTPTSPTRDSSDDSDEFDIDFDSLLSDDDDDEEQATL